MYKILVTTVTLFRDCMCTTVLSYKNIVDADNAFNRLSATTIDPVNHYPVKLY